MGCKITSVTIHAKTPPTLGKAVLYGVDMPVYIPAGTKNNYKNASEWSKFTNFIER